MSKKYHKSKTLPSAHHKILSTLLGLGVVIATTQGAPFCEQNKSITSIDFTAKVIKDLHTHTDAGFAKDRVLLDPRSLRSVRSEDDKLAELDLSRDGWSVYRV
ncbi:hypothetical protein FWG95_00590 [Candidatus Saccharibacteria bacterium]|nr:hypothetical protein [Candidatus Saccharibacteria bacterium]